MKETGGNQSAAKRDPALPVGMGNNQDDYQTEYDILRELSLIPGCPDGCDSRIVAMLRETAIRTGLSRIIIFECNDQSYLSASYEWCSKGVAELKETLKNIDCRILPSLKAMLEKEKALLLVNDGSLPTDIADFLDSMNARTALFCEMPDRGRKPAMVYFEDNRNEISWVKSTTDLFITVTGILSRCFGCNKYLASLRYEKSRSDNARREKEESITRLSHEIRSPLGAILGMCESLYYKVDNENTRKLVRSILSNGSMLMTVLNNALEMSRLEAGKFHTISGKVNISSLLEDIDASFRDIAAKKNLNLTTETSTGLPGLVLTDEVRLKQILFNIVTNAITYTRWGQISITADFIPFEDNMGRLVFRVHDTGPGLREEDLRVIFDEYSQFEDADFYNSGSTGLGLTYSRKLAEALGGTIKAESSEGKGTQFTIILPAEVASTDTMNQRKQHSTFL